jgi:nicotinate dehydrogenase subunit B
MNWEPGGLTFEPERYELTSRPLHSFEVDRRDFFKTLGGGIVIAVCFPAIANAQESGGGRGRGGAQAAPQVIGAWLHIDANGTVTAFTGKVEVGQNARTSLSMAIAEELGAPLTSVELVMGDTDRTPYDFGTVGSQTTPNMVPQLRRAAASARQALIELAAAKWNVAAGTLRAEHGAVTDGKQSATFGELAGDQQIYKRIANPAAVKPTSQWTVMGRSTPKLNGREIVTGQHKYTSDMQLPGMLYGRVLRPETFGATLASLDATAAKAMSGVTVVRDGDFAGVTAPTTSAAASAVSALRASWKNTPQTSARTLFTDLKEPVSASPAIDKALAEAHHKLERTYPVAYIAHTPLEPRAALAQWDGDKLTVWTGTQRPFGVRSELAQAFRIPEENVRVIVPDTGSGYGGKHTGDAALEAARLAKGAGKPVKVTWTREEEFTWAYFRPAGVIDVRSAVDLNGKLTAWEFHNFNSGNSGLNTYYDVANKRVEFHNTKSPLRQGSYRGLAATANHFAREAHMSELAALAGIDPLEFRLKNLTDPRVRAVLQAAADKFGWGKRQPAAGTGFGIAAGFEKGGYVATCAEVSVQPGRESRIVRLTEAFECGAIVNPDHLYTQVEGAMIMGLGGALFEAIDFADGKILNPHLARYRVPRFRDVPPQIEVVLVDRKDLPSAGAGETPIVTVAPAIASAIHSAIGEWHRSLPMLVGVASGSGQSGGAAF